MKKIVSVMFSVFAGTCLLFSSCSSENEEVIPEDKMIDVLYDFHMAQALANSGAFGATRYERALYENSVYAKHGVTEAQFDSSLVWYTRRTKVLADIYREVSKRMKEENRNIDKLISIRDKKPMISEPGDTVDVWAWNRAVRLSRAVLNNIYTFSLPSDSNYHDTDSLVWSAHYRLLPLGSNDSVASNSLVMGLMMRYAKDTTVNRYVNLSQSGRMSLSIQNDTLGRIKNISGMLYFMPDTMPCVVVADSITLYRYHVKREVSLLKDSLQLDSIQLEDESSKEDEAKASERRSVKVRGKKK